MRLWKRLLGTALCLCAAVCLMSVSASAAEHSSHPICGAAHTDIGDHTGSCGDVTWEAWNGTSEISYDSNNTACVYLSDSAARNGALKVSNGQTLNLCLNGKTLSSTYTVIEVKGNATLNICDCQGGGGITISSGCVIETDTRDYVNRKAVLGTATLNLYGGKLSTDDTHDSGTVKLYNNDGGEPQTVAVFNMYGGEVHNKDFGESAVYASHANIGTGYYNINMYGGSVTCEKGNGFELNNNKNITMQITGGMVTSGWYGVRLSSQNTLTLAGNPKFIDTAFYPGSANIFIPGDVTLTVKDDFTPAGGTKVSVEKSVDSPGSVVFAVPAESSKSLSSKAQHFVSAKEGYFVESNNDGELQLTACAITGQPTVENSYTVTANGSDDKVKYQWYSAKKGDVPVTENSVKGTGNLFYWNEKWSCSLGEVTGFTLTMKKDDVLTLDCSENYGVHIGSVTLSDGKNTVNGMKGEDQTYTLIAPADGDYTLKIRCFVEEHAELQFTAKVTADVPDLALDSQTAATLNTTGLPSGSYICKVTWENKTTRNSQAVRHGSAPSHAHSWSSEWTSDATHHWHECKNGCTEKDGYGPHSGGAANCTQQAVCTICGAAYGALDAANHSGALGDWKSDENNHWKEYSCCHVHADKAPHNWDTGVIKKQPTCTTAGEKTFTCTVCNGTKKETLAALEHNYGEPSYAWNGTSCTAERVCSRDSSHKETETVTAAVTVTQNKSCLLDELSTYTARFQNAAFATQTQKNVVTANKLGHDFENGTWQSDGDGHWKKCSRCDVTDEANKAPHNWGAGVIKKQPTCTTAGEKTYTCNDCNRTKKKQIDALGHDWGEWRVTKQATTSAAGEETRTCKRDKSHTETRAIPKLTPAPSGGGSSSAPAITVPVSGSGDTVHVSASVSGSTAEVKEIKSAELDKIGTDSAVVIDLSGLNKGVTGVTLSTDTIDSICKTEADGVTIKLPSAELRVDRQTLAAVTEQAAGSKIRLVVEPDSTARGTMTAAQKSTLAGMKNAAALEAYFVSNNTRIHDFKGGSVELSIPYRAEGAIRAWFLKEDGTREPVSARYDKENAQLILHHFSHYVIEELDSSAAYTVCAKDDSCPLGAFGDLTATAWYHDGVHYCVEKGLMHGISADKFLPDGSVTRAQLAAILWRLEGSPKTTGAVRFGDTAGGAWYTEAVRWAAGCGVVKGYDNGCFGPNDAVTREQMAAILYRYAQHNGYDVSAGKDTNILSFNDAFTVSEYAIPAMQWACGSGMVRGIAQKGGMLLAPMDTTTRAQTATLLMRFQSAFAKEP